MLSFRFRDQMAKYFNIKKLITLCLILLIAQVLFAQLKSEHKEINNTIALNSEFFGNDDPIFFTLKFDIKTFRKTRSKEEYQPVELTYQLNDSTSFTHHVKLRSRGDFRKKYCSLPPFWLNIKGAELGFTDLDDVVKMKVVTHCKKAAIYSDYILKEYLAYKLYNIISPYSYRVRLVKIQYIDTGRDNKIMENWGFIMEPEELMEKRLDARFIENDKLAMATVNKDIMDRLAFFQYMIGNCDYSVTGRHNLKIITLNGSGPIGNIPIPYDFDYTGFVNTSYAIPGDNLGINSVTERYFLGPCRGDHIYELHIQAMNDSKREFLHLLQRFEYLTLKQKIETLNYIESYYTEASSKWFIARNLKGTCR